MVRLTAGKMVELNFGAAMGREIRLTLDGTAFASGSATPSPALEAGLNQLIAVLEEHEATLRVVYRDGTADTLARQRVEEVVAQIRQHWRRAREPYRLVINTDIAGN
jgi:hypothetical protein